MKKTLLIVEDNLILCDILERWLQKAGYRVLTAIDDAFGTPENQGE